MQPRVALVGGCRTPFVKAGGVFAEQSFLDLGVHVVRTLSEQLDLKSAGLDELAFGTVLLDPRIPNAARELVLRSGLPKALPAHFVSNNCITGLVAINSIREGILSGRIRSGIAAGSESMSRPSLAFRPEGERFFLALSRARSFGERLAIIAKFRPRFVLPIPPSPKEPSTGLTMGQHCEISAQEFEISRADQDQWALRSHQRAAAAQASGALRPEIEPLLGVDADNLVRSDTTLEKLSRLKPVFDRGPKGTITAGTSSALTDGASAVCLMSDEEARRQGREILAYVDAIEFAAIDPAHGLLMAPALALPRLLERAKVKLDQIDRFEIHEAFAAQVCANRLVWAKGWKRFPELEPLGEIPDEKINVHGGSIALGHPFAATGGRLLLALASELKRSGLKRGAISVCAAGAMAGAMLVSAP